MKKKYIIIAFLVSIFLSCMLYANTLSGEFIFDDDYFYRRQELREVGNLTKIWFQPLTNIKNLEIAETYRPLLVFTFSLNFLLFGEGTESFHVFNILLNGIVCFLLFLLIYKLFKNLFLAALCGLIFAFLPIHTEAVSFIKAREEMLGMGFMLSSWLLFLSGTERAIRFRYIIFAAICFFLGVLSKEFLLLFPVVFFTLYIKEKKPSINQIARLATPFVLFAALFMYMWYTSLGGKLPLDNIHSYATNPIAYADVYIRIWTAFAILALYIFQTFIPINLSATYRFNHFPLAESFFDIRSIIGLFLFVAFLLPFFIKKLRSTPLFVASLLFFVTYFPFSKVIFTGGEFIAERWMYFPTAACALAVAYGISLLKKNWRYIACILLGIVFILYGIVTVQRNTVWISAEALYTSMTIDAPNSAFGYVWLARYYLVMNNFKGAEENIVKALEIYPNHNQVMAAYAAVLVNKELYSEAETAIRKAIEIKPESSSYYYLALTLTKQGEYRSSQEVLEKYLRERMTQSPIRFLSAVNLYKLGEEKRAREFFNWNLNLTEDEKIKAISEF